MSNTYAMSKKLTAEFLGTLWLVFGGCGSAIYAASFMSGGGTEIGIGLLGVAFAFGLTVLTGAYAFGHISGGHFNPAVTAGLVAGGRHPSTEFVPYVVAQVLGAVAAGFLLYLIAQGADGFAIKQTAGTFATNGYGDFSPSGYSMGSAFIIEVLLTAFFLIIIMGATHKFAPAGFAPIAIGLGLTLIHLISIPITNTSVNPARSTGVALIAGGMPLKQLWLFWVAPLIGGLIGGGLYAWLARD